MEGYTHLLECAEATLAYTALTAIYLSQYLNREPFKKVNELAARFNSKRGAGINFGDWRAILDEARSKRFKKLAGNAPFFEVTNFLENPKTLTAISDLIQARNDQAHGRGPKGAEINSVFHERKASLEELLKGVDFLSEYPLRYIEQARWDSIRRETSIKYRDLTGDHPLTPIQEDVVNNEPIEQGSLYWRDREGHYHRVRPLMLRRRCPECGTLATFTLDGYDYKNGVCRLKSLEHGHIAATDETEITEAFQVIGLLSADG